ncbi:MAG: AAA domain-containing protein [Gammaproteobacteria bacterium]
MELTESHKRLIDLVDYVSHMVRMAERPVFALKEYKQLVFHEVELRGRVGIHHDLADEDGAIWLRIDRLNRLDPPPVHAEIAEWVIVSRDPFKPPEIRAVRTATIEKAEADRLVANGTLAAKDVQSALKPKPGKTLCDVAYRLERLPKTKQAVESYIGGPWATWSEKEKPRRNTIAIYDAFFSVQQAIDAESGDQPLEVVWGVGVARWRIEGREFDHPIVEQLVELQIDPKGGAITVRPRSTEPQLALKPYLAVGNPGADAVFQSGRKHLAELPDDAEFSPYIRKTFEPVLRQAAAQIDKEGCYYPDEVKDVTDRALPDPRSELVVTDTWAIYARRRSDNFMSADLDRLKSAIAECKDLPGPATRVVTEPSDSGGYRPEFVNIGGGLSGFQPGMGGGAGGGLSTASATIDDSRTHDFFFPKPFNDEQVSIIQRLMDADGVVVQGPPGTGKTHTIANIICHYLATGKRVLVTSKGEAALTVLRDHIPAGIRELVISLLANEREGLKQLERAVDLLANTITQLKPKELERDIVSGQQRILELQSKIAKIEQELRQWATKHLTPIRANDGQSGPLPMDLAKTVDAERDAHRWFPDRLAPDAKPQFSDADIAAVREARREIVEDLVYLDAELPSPSDLPDAGTLSAIHQDLVSAATLEDQRTTQQVPLLSLLARHAVERAQQLADWVNDISEFLEAAAPKPWLVSLYETWLVEGIGTEHTVLFNGLLEEMRSIAERRTAIIGCAIQMPPDALQSDDVCGAVAKAAQGARPFGWIPFGRSSLRALFNQIRIANRAPASADEWQKVHGYVAWRHEIHSFTVRWNALRAEFDLPAIQDDGDQTGRLIAQTLDQVTRAQHLASQRAGELRAELGELFPHGLDADNILRSIEAARAAADAIALNLAKVRLASRRTYITELLDRLRTMSGRVVSRIRDLLMHRVGNTAVTVGQLVAEWSELCRELGRIHELRPALETVGRVTAQVTASGAPRWAEALRTQAVTGVDDDWTLGHWRASWVWARRDSYLRKIDGRGRIRQLSNELLQHEADLKRTFAKVVELRTYLGLKQNITNRVAAALAMFMTAIRNIGQGTGIRARRFRRDARDAMERCYSAVPCWVMPTWRISESLPAKLGSFDLVIVDEASQSDITALPALLRGKKVLIVGDDKQVSPTAAFVEERKILQLQHNFLKGQPFAAAMLPGSSLYGLAQAMFPGDRIMLREHFRCVEPIIRFCFRFYTEPLVPLRLPSASERLDPPLIDVYVEDGCRDKREVNEPEARAIVDEIERLVRDPAYAKRNIGVVSLIGAKQAQFIQQLLLERIGEEVYVRHDIACGDSATFQGKERDIMFISMVACPRTKRAQTSLPFQQRFNVALSRARDREYLFRSVTEEMLDPEDLKAKVIRHFHAPMENAPREVDDLIELCESVFEREVFSRLVTLGYRVTPQVNAGAYRIDLVVEGNDDRRLAIELDGDKYHAPDRWADDLARQRVLERVGWRFWRCWGSSWTLDPHGCLEDLMSVLKEMGIEPIGGEARSTVYTGHRTVGCGTSEVAELQEQALRARGADQTSDARVPRMPDSDTATIAAVTSKSGAAGVFEEQLLVQPGARVLISYNDEPSRQYVITLSPFHHDPDNLVIRANMPLAQALMGYGEGDEVEIPAGGAKRTVTILKTERPTAPEGVGA